MRLITRSVSIALASLKSKAQMPARRMASPIAVFSRTISVQTETAKSQQISVLHFFQAKHDWHVVGVHVVCGSKFIHSSGHDRNAIASKCDGDSSKPVAEGGG